jgi:hypothetical protein
MNASHTAPSNVAHLRKLYATEQQAALAAGWTVAQFRCLVDALVAERTPEGWTEAARAACKSLRDANLTGDVHAVLGDVELVAFDVYRRAFNRDTTKLYSEANKRMHTVYAPAGSSLSMVLAANKFAGLAQSTIYELQGDRGIWKHYRGRSLDASCDGTERACFLTWEEMEAIELAGGVPFAEVEDPTEQLAA